MRRQRNYSYPNHVIEKCIIHTLKIQLIKLTIFTIENYFQKNSPKKACHLIDKRLYCFHYFNSILSDIQVQ